MGTATNSRVSAPGDYEVKIWQRGTQDWCWAVRLCDGRMRSNGLRWIPIDSGSRHSNHQKAKDAARRAVLGDEAARKAQWKPLEA